MGPATDAWVKEMDGRRARLFGSQLEGPSAPGPCGARAPK